jgi:hypothetical protein
MLGFSSRPLLLLALIAATPIGSSPALSDSPAATKTYYVATDGADGNAGDSLEKPFRTLERAVDAVKPGDTIELRAGDHRGLKITKPGTSNGWITLRRHGQEKARIVPSRSGRPTLYFYHRSCDEDTPNNYPCQPLYWAVEGLEIEGSGIGGGDDNVVKIDTPHIRLKGNNLYGSSADVIKLVHTADDVEIIENEIHHPRAKPGANAQGIDIVGADRTRVAHNHVHDIPSIGVYAKGNSRNTVFEANLVENTFSHGIMLGQETDAHRLRDGKYETYDGIMRNNVVRNAGWSCFATSSSFRVRIYNNTCYQERSTLHGAILLSNESEVGQAGTHIEILNNIIYGAPNLPVVKLTAKALTDPATLVVDYNVYWTARGSGSVTFTWRDRGLEQVPFSRWQQTGQDAHSRVADPLFTTLQSLRPSATSPAAAAGAPTPYVTIDFADAPRPSGRIDIGAYEFSH